MHYYFPPDPVVASRRLGHLAETLVRAGHRVTVVTVARSGRPTVEDWRGMRILRFPVQDVRSRILGEQPESLTLSYRSKGTRRSSWRAWAFRLARSFPFSFLAGDGGPLYARQRVRQLRAYVEREGVTHLFSSFSPWADHLLAHRLKKRFPQLYWTADFRDLPVDPVRREIWWPALQRWWGKRIIRRADELWTVSAGQREQLLAWHARIKIRRNALLRLPPASSAPVSERFTIVYTGSLYPQLQSVRPLIAAIESLLVEGAVQPAEICLRYRGKDGALFDRWASALPEVCRDIQPGIAPASAQEMQRNAQLLLLLNWSAPDYSGVLTAKLWDYLASGRPILALVNGPGDPELSAIIQGADAGAVFAKGEQAAVREWLAALLRRWQAEGTLAWRTERAWLRQYLPTA